jgi:hypothetical protein
MVMVVKAITSDEPRTHGEPGGRSMLSQPRALVTSVATAGSPSAPSTRLANVMPSWHADR